MAPRSILLCGVLAVAPLGACKQPKIALTASPMFPCKGEDVSFSFSTKHLDHVEVKDADGNVLLSTNAASGNFVAPGIGEETRLPLKAKGTQGDESRTVKIPNPYYPFQIINGPTKIQTQKLRDTILDHREEIVVGQVGCNCTHSYDEVTCESYPDVVHVYAYYSGQQKEVLQALFSPRARVVRIDNASNFRLTFTRASVEVAELGPGGWQSFDYSEDIYPWGLWAVKYQPGDLHEVYLGAYVKSKICGGWLQQGFDVKRIVDLEMTVQCDQ